MANNFPISILKQPTDINSVLRNESAKFYKALTNSGYFSNLTGGGSVPAQVVSSVTYPYYAVPQVSIVKDTWNTLALGVVLPTAGRAIYIKKIIVKFSHPSKLGIRTSKNGSTYGLAGDNQPFISGVFNDEIYEVSTASNTLVIDYSDNPKRVKYGEQISMWYSREENLSSNWSLIIEGVEVTNDEYYNSKFLYGVMGDSFCVTSDTKELEYANRNGVIQGIWPFIINEYLKSNGIESRVSNIGLGGTNTTQWEIDVANGLFRRWRPDILSCNLGINDSASVGYFSTTSGMDGIYKTAYKNIIKGYFKERPDGCMIINQIADTDKSAQKTVFASGIYNGLTYIQAIRLETTALVSELKALNPTWDLVLADTSPSQTYLSSEPLNYLTGEQGAGNRLHPNARLGQPKLAIKIIEAINTTTFYNKYKIT